jgi:hypothetical protein
MFFNINMTVYASVVLTPANTTERTIFNSYMQASQKSIQKRIDLYQKRITATKSIRMKRLLTKSLVAYQKLLEYKVSLTSINAVTSENTGVDPVSSSVTNPSQVTTTSPISSPATSGNIPSTSLQVNTSNVTPAVSTRALQLIPSRASDWGA